MTTKKPKKLWEFKEHPASYYYHLGVTRGRQAVLVDVVLASGLKEYIEGVIKNHEEQYHAD